MAWKRHKGTMGGIEIAKHGKSVTRNWIFDSFKYWRYWDIWSCLIKE